MFRALTVTSAFGLLSVTACVDRTACAPVPPEPLAEPSASASASAVSAPPSSSAIAAIPYDLPKAADIGLPAAPESARGVEAVLPAAALDIAADGTLYFNGRRLADDGEVLVEARLALRTDPNARAVIRADRSVPWGRVAHAMDLLKQAGIARLAFGVAAPKQP